MGKIQSTALIVPSGDAVFGARTEAPTAPVDGSPRRRSTMFVKARAVADDSHTLDLSAANDDFGVACLEHHGLIAEVLGLFFFSDREPTTSIRISMLVNSMKSEVFKKGKIVMAEGELADKLYVLASGQVEVEVDGEVVRALSRGALIGELGLLYNTTRTATVRCLTACELWALDKNDFLQFMSIASPWSVVQRGRWLSEIAELRALGSVGMSVLIGNLEKTRLDYGVNLYTRGELTTRCILIETGVGVIELPPELVDESPDNIDKMLGIARPRAGRRKDWAHVEIPHLLDYLASPDTKPAQPISLEEAQPPFTPITLRKGYHFVHEGCVLGMGVIFGKAGVSFRDESPDFAWSWDRSSDNSISGSGESICGGTAQSGSRTRTKSKSFDGAVAPYTCFVESKTMTCSFITVDTLTELFGNLPLLVRSLVKHASRKKGVITSPNTCRQNSSRSTGRTSFLRDVISLKEMERVAARPFLQSASDKDLRVTSLLALGTKSTIVLADAINSFKECGSYALKIMSKDKILNNGKLRHTMDECKLLAHCHHPFIATFHGVYQTDRDIVLCMEAVYQWDLHRIIQGSSRGMPLDTVRFYAASIVMALDHMHRKGIAYRGLHPENVKIDSRGFIRIIDFAFAKPIPFLMPDNSGNVKMCLKSFTLCGTAEYMAPECIFNMGSNHAVDMWALGVIVHEMHTQATPFVGSNKNASEMDILQAVAVAKKSGVTICSSWDILSGPSWKNFILQLLVPDMNSRLGVADKNTLSLLEHGFFNSVDKEALIVMKGAVPFIPEHRQLPHLIEMACSEPFTGNQALFERFKSIGISLGD